MFALILAMQAASAAPPPTLAAALQPLAFMVGSCWRATFPNSANTDTHCYTAMLGGRYVRDAHVVGGGPPYAGEAIYRWDPRARRIRYDYYASDGGHSSGMAVPIATGLDFPEDEYVGPDGAAMTLRTVQTGDAAGYTRVSSIRPARRQLARDVHAAFHPDRASAPAWVDVHPGWSPKLVRFPPRWAMPVTMGTGDGHPAAGGWNRNGPNRARKRTNAPAQAVAAKAMPS